MRLSEVRAYGRLWQDRLKLSEWEIVWRWMTKAERVEHPEWNGFCSWNEQHKFATIAISRRAEHTPHTIIHELLHVRDRGHEPQPASTSIPEEVKTNALAELFVRLEGIHPI